MFDNPCRRRQFLMSAGATALSAYSGLALAAPNGDGPKQGVYARAVLESAPLAYWRLDETRGPTARDATGHGNDARCIGNPTFGQKGAIAAETDHAIGLRGPRTKSYLEVRDRDNFSIATSGKGLTIEVWMRPDLLEFKGETAENYIHWLGKGEKNHIEWGLRFYPRRSDRPNRISAYVWNPDGSQGAGAYVEDELTISAWIYLVATFDDPRKPNAQVRIFKNGRPSPHNESPGGALQTVSDNAPARS